MTSVAVATNPILPGCYPDPTICRVGDDYYLVASTFEYFPGLPIFHSTNLVDWKLIDHVITEADQLDYTGIRSSGGLYAPTIRHDGEKFWVVCTLVAHEGRHPGGNFLMTAPNISGPWSEPVWLDVGGIDPSIFFDDDGKIWLHGTRLVAEPEWPSQTETWLREYDPEARALVGPEHVLWRGAVRGAVWSEAPHIYKIDGSYYLLTAEGGTDFHHAVSVARADTVTGPYVGAPTNPIFTHRHLGRDYPIVGAGHADLVQAVDGSWWAMLLAMRTYGGYHYNLGRETFLVPVVWEDGWPVFAPGVGQLSDSVEVPASVGVGGGAAGAAAGSAAAGAAGAESAGAAPDPLDWTTVRGPLDFVTELDEGWRLAMRPTTVRDRGRPAFMGVRQRHKNAQARAQIDVALERGEEVGVIVRQSEEDHVRCAVVRDEENGRLEFVIVHREKGTDRVLARADIEEGAGRKDGSASAALKDNATSGALKDNASSAAPSPIDSFNFEISARGQDYRVSVAANAGDGISADFDGRSLDSVSTGGFLGLWFGAYATSNGRVTSTQVDLTKFTYAALD